MTTAHRLAALSVFGLAALAAQAPAHAGDTVNVLVLREHGVGSAAQAQPYVDKFIGLAAKLNGWADGKGKYETTRGGADGYIQGQKPHYGILSFGAFLGLQGKHKFEAIGQVNVSKAGGQQYHLISKTAGDLAGCRGKKLASDHADDSRFIDNVVFGGKARLADFTLVATQRPMQTIKKVAGDEAECALIDDAQYEQLTRGLEGTAGVRSVWKSDKLPPMVVVAFPSAPAGERRAFQGNLGKVCEGEGKAACAEVGIQSLRSASASDYAAAVAAYAR